MLSVPTAPHAYFQSVKRLNVQCRCKVLGREGLGLGPGTKVPSHSSLYPVLCISEYRFIDIFSLFSFLLYFSFFLSFCFDFFVAVFGFFGLFFFFFFLG